MYRHVTDSKLPRLSAPLRRKLNIPSLNSGNLTDLVYTEDECYLRDFSSILRIIRIGAGPQFEFNCNWAIQGKTWKPVADIDSHPMDFKHFSETSKLVKVYETDVGSIESSLCYTLTGLEYTHERHIL
jgi:hypothetical protein